ncbi:hypothetical protein FQN50_003027 [Emmonsiellopsis sp. PD_5]|nr:hypothetical protein FQN50_003027 [Emmonsiellopsis sp. PD_5]
MAALASPEPPICGDDCVEVLKSLRKPGLLVGYVLLLTLGTEVPHRPTVPEQFEVFRTYSDGTEIMMGIYPTLSKTPRLSTILVAKMMDAIMKCGAEDAVTPWAAAKAAAKQHGGWDAALTAIFDCKFLFDGEFGRYLTEIFVSGAHGFILGLLPGAIRAFFGANEMMCELVGAFFGCLPLSSIFESFEQFCKKFGVAAFAALGSYGGRYLGKVVCGIHPILSVGQPFASFTFSFIGGRLMESFGRMVCKVDKSPYERIKEALAKIDLEPDPLLSKEDVVEGMIKCGTERKPFRVKMTESMTDDVKDLRDELSTLQSSSPAKFGEFLDELKKKCCK